MKHIIGLLGLLLMSMPAAQGAPRIAPDKLAEAIRGHMQGPTGQPLKAIDRVVKKLGGYSTVRQGADDLELMPGQTVTLRTDPVNGPTLVGGAFVRIPSSARRVEIGLDLFAQNVNVDLFVRYTQDIEIQNGQLVFDASSENPAGEDESIVLTSQSTPQLRAGVLFVAFGVLTTGQAIDIDLTVIIDDSGPFPPCESVLTSGTPRQFQRPASNELQLLFDNAFDCIDVPEGATRLTIRLEGTPENAQFVLTATANRDAFVGDLDPDFFVVDNPLELEIDAQSDPALASGRYFFTTAVAATTVAVQGTFTVTVEGGGGGNGGGNGGGGSGPGELTTVSAAGFGGDGVAHNMIVASFGSGLATRTEVAQSVPLPIQVAGSTVQIVDSRGGQGYAGIFFGSPGQMNWLFPDWPAPGIATITVRAEDGSESVGTLEVRPAVPGLFAANPDGSGPPFGSLLHVSASGVQTPRELFRCGTVAGSCVPTPIDLGEEGEIMVLILYGTGFRDAQSVTAQAGGENLPVYGAVAQGQFEGLDQANVQLVAALRGKGDVAVSISGDDGIAALSKPGPVRIVRKSNEVIVNIGPPPFTIEDANASGAPAGSTRSGFTINGQGLATATGVEFAPPAGITVSGFQASASSVTMNLAIAPDAAAGQRMMSVVSAGGRSNWIVFEVM
jgi:uncharacterized protein (TIGR03437 family)